MGPNMEKDCEALRPFLSGLAAGSLEEPREREVREHLVGCPACRELQAAVDPAVLFLELRGRPLPATFWEGFQEEIRARLPERRPDWAALFRYPRLAYLTAPLAMILILGATLFVMRPGRFGLDRPYSPQPMPSPYGQAGRRPGAERIGQPPGGSRLPLELPAGAGIASAPLLEEVSSPSARVYRFSVGGTGTETPIYLVVDESIDI